MSRTPRPVTTPTPRPDDSPAMRAALHWLSQARIPFTRPTPYQLKIGTLNYYPDRGTLFRDGDRQALPDRGLDALQALLGKLPQHGQRYPVHRPDRARPYHLELDDQNEHTGEIIDLGLDRRP